MTTIATDQRRSFRGYVPPRRMIRWPFSAFATVIMAVFPLFWPILGVMILAEAFCVVLWLALLIITNVVMMVAWLAGAVVSR